MEKQKTDEKKNINRSACEKEMKNSKEEKKVQFLYRELLGEYEGELDERFFGDEYFLFDGEDGRPKYEDLSEPWDKFIDWLETIRGRLRASENFVETCEYKVGQEVIKYAARHDMLMVYLMVRNYWVDFRNAYLLVEDCPEYILEFVRGLLYKKMTEKQMWGTREDRMAEGTLIVFDKKYIPKEGEYDGKLKIEYQPIDTRTRAERMREEEEKRNACNSSAFC